jgi:hypothetical protein
MRSIFAALLCSFCGLASATSATTDYSDLWWNPSESGWGVNVTQQDTVLFATFFVYGSNGAPTWFVAPDVELTGSVQINGASPTPVFQGTLYQTTGPYFGTAFNPASVTSRVVGTITFTTTGASTATVSYSVDGTTVTKAVERQTWRSENLAGIYVGASTGTWSSCGAARNGYQEAYSTYTVTQDGVHVTIREDSTAGTCTYTGVASSAGRLGTITGTGLCSDGINQSFTASEVQVSPPALTMKFAATGIGSTCTYSGRLGGLRRAP